MFQYTKPELMQNKTKNSIQKKTIQESPISPNLTGIPDTMKAQYENLSGLLFDDVRVHYESDKPAQLQALAYTQGNQVYIAPGQEKHLRHELGHIIQQKQGLVQPTGYRNGLPVNEDVRLEAEADRQSMFMPQNERKNFMPQNGRGVIQKQDAPFKTFHMNEYQSKRWFELAEDYEKQLGKYAYTHHKANKAAERGIYRILEVLEDANRISGIPEQAKIEDSTDATEDGIRKYFLSNDKESAGQVGTDIPKEAINRIFSRGNLRERMTMFYNAAYFKCGYGDGVIGLKCLLQHIVFEKKIEEAKKLGLDEQGVQKQINYFDSFYRDIMRMIAKCSYNKAYLFDKDLFALGNLVLQSDNWKSDLEEIAMSQKDRFERSDQEQISRSKTPDDYATMDAPLSEEELRLAIPRLKNNLFATEEERYAARHTEPLPWKEGVKLFDIKPDTSWFNDVHNQLKMPVVAGISGTTTRMLTAFKLIKVPESSLLDFRLAIIGWMLTSRDHSLYEILRGSHMAGVIAPGEAESVKDATKIYTNIAPLTIGELRHIGERDMFPHELLYYELTRLNALDQDHLPGLELDQVEAAHNSLVNDAHSIAIRGYTSGMHILYNTVMSHPIQFTAILCIYKELEKQALLYIKNRKKEDTWIGALDSLIPQLDKCYTETEQEKKETILEGIKDQLNKMAQDLYPIIKVHISMTLGGLRALPPAQGEVYRGDWQFKLYSEYKENNIVTLKSFTSYSRDKKQAKKFAEQYEGSTFKRPIIIKLTLKGKNGRDISELSIYDEHEVLLLPGARIKYNKIVNDDELGDLLEAEEV